MRADQNAICVLADGVSERRSSPATALGASELAVRLAAKRYAAPYALTTTASPTAANTVRSLSLLMGDGRSPGRGSAPQHSRMARTSRP